MTRNRTLAVNWARADKMDYVFRLKVNLSTRPVALARIEAKKDSLLPRYGLDQAKGCAGADVSTCDLSSRCAKET